MLHRKCNMMVGWFVLVCRKGQGNYNQLLFNLVLYITIIHFSFFLSFFWVKIDDS